MPPSTAVRMPSGRAHAYPARHGHGDLGAIVAAERPRLAATSQRVDDRLVSAQIRRCLRNAGFLEIARRPDNQSPSSQDASRGHRRIVERTHAQRHVDTLFEQIDRAVVEDDVDTQFRMPVEESLERGQNMQSRERDGCTDPQASGEAVRRFPHCLFGLICFIDRTAGVS